MSNGTSISIEQAYREACQALGEAVVMQRLLSAELARHQADEGPAPGPPDPAGGPGG